MRFLGVLLSVACACDSTWPTPKQYARSSEPQQRGCVAAAQSCTFLLVSAWLSPSLAVLAAFSAAASAFFPFAALPVSSPPFASLSFFPPLPLSFLSFALPLSSLPFSFAACPLVDVLPLSFSLTPSLSPPLLCDTVLSFACAQQ